MWGYRQKPVSLCKYNPTRGVNTIGKKLDSHRAKLESVAQDLNVKLLTDWYNVKQDVIEMFVIFVKFSGFEKNGHRRSFWVAFECIP
jgi:hypothetical protein